MSRKISPENNRGQQKTPNTRTDLQKYAFSTVKWGIGTVFTASFLPPLAIFPAGMTIVRGIKTGMEIMRDDDDLKNK